MTRRVIQHQAKTLDNEILTIITVFEEGLKKEQIKKLNPFSKKHEILVKRAEGFEFIK